MQTIEKNGIKVCIPEKKGCKFRFLDFNLVLGLEEGVLRIESADKLLAGLGMENGAVVEEKVKDYCIAPDRKTLVVAVEDGEAVKILKWNSQEVVLETIRKVRMEEGITVKSLESILDDYVLVKPVRGENLKVSVSSGEVVRKPVLVASKTSNVNTAEPINIAPLHLKSALKLPEYMHLEKLEFSLTPGQFASYLKDNSIREDDFITKNIQEIHTAEQLDVYLANTEPLAEYRRLRMHSALNVINGRSVDMRKKEADLIKKVGSGTRGFRECSICGLPHGKRKLKEIFKKFSKKGSAHKKSVSWIVDHKLGTCHLDCYNLYTGRGIEDHYGRDTFSNTSYDTYRNSIDEFLTNPFTSLK